MSIDGYDGHDEHEHHRDDYDDDDDADWKNEMSPVVLAGARVEIWVTDRLPKSPLGHLLARLVLLSSESAPSRLAGGLGQHFLFAGPTT